MAAAKKVARKYGLSCGDTAAESATMKDPARALTAPSLPRPWAAPAPPKTAPSTTNTAHTTAAVPNRTMRLPTAVPKMFAASFGKGGGPRGDASSRARWREREDERRHAARTPGGGGGGGGGGRGAAAEVASDDLVFKRWMNNEKKRVRR